MNINEIRKANIKSGGHWFDEDKMAHTPRFGPVHEGPGGMYFTALHTDDYTGENWQVWRFHPETGAITCPDPHLRFKLDYADVVGGSEEQRRIMDQAARRHAAGTPEERASKERERQETSDERRAGQEREHREKFGAFVESLGREGLETLLPVRDPAKLRRLLEEDENLNNVPLVQWDARHEIMRRLAQRALRLHKIGEPGADGKWRTFWSLSDTVCTLKECARQVAERAG